MLLKLSVVSVEGQLVHFEQHLISFVVLVGRLRGAHIRRNGDFCVVQLGYLELLSALQRIRHLLHLFFNNCAHMALQQVRLLVEADVDGLGEVTVHLPAVSHLISRCFKVLRLYGHVSLNIHLRERALHEFNLLLQLHQHFTILSIGRPEAIFHLCFDFELGRELIIELL